ncbi:hypothetical protein ABZP36_035432 [Zizania latifolia]
MGVAYRRLAACESRRVGGVSAAAAAAAARAWWAAVRRTAARLYAAAPARRRRRLALARARAAGYEYDPASHARNFDDGVWKAEEGVFWSAGGADDRRPWHVR